MKGTFFSADFVRDKEDNLRLIEINTDTGIVEDQKSVLDWTNFISIIKENNIDTVEVTYKASIQAPVIASLANALELHAPEVTTFNAILIDENNIFPGSSEDAPNKFILRMAYDELAILDSEYAKGTLNLLKLFADNDSSASVVGFKHSSRAYGEYDTLDYDLPNPINVPDFVTKTIEEEHASHNFYKLGCSSQDKTIRVANFGIEQLTPHTVIEEYHYNPTVVEENGGKVTSIRTFQIVYGPNLDLCYVAEYEIPAILQVPTEINIDDTAISNTVSSKHYYEFATNHIKNLRHGFLGDTKILDAEGNSVEIKDTVVGNTYKSYYINEAPDTDDIEIFENWNYAGSTLPAGSHITASVLVDKYEKETYTTEMTLLTFKNGNEIVLGGESRLLVYSIAEDKICYKKVLDITAEEYKIVAADAALEIEKVETVIFDEPQKAYALGLEEVDNFILDNGINGLSIGVFFLVAHNCFIAGTEIKMADGNTKNIEDITDGDIVLSLNEVTKEVEPKVVYNVRQFSDETFITIALENGKVIVSTLDHPYYTENLALASYNGTTTDGNKLKVGDALYTLGGEKSNIKEITELNYTTTPVYIFTVEDNHNFYANEILVHNK